MQKDNIIGLKIAYYRKLNGFTQEELAEKVGVSCQAVSKWEQQLSCPDSIFALKELILSTFSFTVTKISIILTVSARSIVARLTKSDLYQRVFIRGNQ